MRVVVTGASGFIGRCFLKEFSQETVVGTCLSHCHPGLLRIDLRERPAVEDFLSNFAPEVVIHCAARPTVDWCENNFQEAWAINVGTTISLAETCAKLGATLAFISTDYVFDGLDGPYVEDDKTNPINVYGALKVEAERAIQNRLEKHLIIRTTNVYGFDLGSKNFLMGILPRLARGEQVCVAIDQTGNPTLADDLCSAVRQLVLSGARGVFHVVGPDLMNRVEWARAAAEAFDIDPDLVVGRTTEELTQAAPRPKKSGLISNRLGSIIREPLHGLEQGLALMKKAWGGEPPIASW